MGGTYTRILFHVVFSTKERRPWPAEAMRPRLYSYMAGTIRGEKGTPYQIGGTADHVHLFLRWRADANVSDLLRDIKRNSSRWIHETYPDMRDFYWQEGFGAFSVSSSLAEKVTHYVANQEEHHRKRSFKEKFIGMLDANKIEYDPELIWR